MSKLSIRFITITFLIMLVTWGTCMVCSINGILLNDNPILYVPYLLGGWSPTIASYFALRNCGEIKSFKEWLKNVFDFKHNFISYLLVIVLGAIYFIAQCLTSGYESGAPLFMIIALMPMMLFGGGLEEDGWRYILQPEMEKKHFFVVSTLFVSIIWWIWHFPLFYITGTGQSSSNIFVFGIGIVAFSFALSTIRKVTGSVWLCVLFHCLTNSLMGIYVLKDKVFGYAVSAVILICASFLAIAIQKKYSLFKKS